MLESSGTEVLPASRLFEDNNVLVAEPSYYGRNGVEGDVLMKEEDIDEEAILNALEDTMHTAENIKQDNGYDISIGTSSEQSFGHDPGSASILNILRQQRIFTPTNADIKVREKVQQQRDVFLAAQRTQRSYDNRLCGQRHGRNNNMESYRPSLVRNSKNSVKF